jgi:hypothetical protein
MSVVNIKFNEHYDITMLKIFMVELQKLIKYLIVLQLNV